MNAAEYKTLKIISFQCQGTMKVILNLSVLHIYWIIQVVPQEAITQCTCWGGEREARVLSGWIQHQDNTGVHILRKWDAFKYKKINHQNIVTMVTIVTFHVCINQKADCLKHWCRLLSLIHWAQFCLRIWN